MDKTEAMREIKKIIVHCSDSDIPTHDDISVIAQWHAERGWVGADKINGTADDVGYHYYIKKDGTVQKGRDLWVIGAHVSGHNSDSIGICLGGRYNFTTKQFHALKALLYDLTRQFNLTTNDVYGHRDFDKHKTCPNFDIKTI